MKSALYRWCRPLAELSRRTLVARISPGKNAAVAGYEPLENRKLLAAGIEWAGGVLTIRGSVKHKF